MLYEDDMKVLENLLIKIDVDKTEEENKLIEKVHVINKIIEKNQEIKELTESISGKEK